MKTLLAICLGWLMISPSLQAKTFMWKVEKDGNYAYIGGTIHLLRDEDLPLPDVYNKAYQETDILVTEVDMKELASAAFAMINRGMYQNGKTLDQEISKEVFEQFKKFCEEHKFPVDALLPMKPTMVNANVVMAMMTRAGAKPEKGIDMMFSMKAISENKPRMGLETVEDQLTALFDSEVDANAIILATIREAAKSEEMLAFMINNLYQGNVEAFETEYLERMKKETPGFYKSLLEVRNNNWMPKVEAMLETPEKELILVGALHLVGEIGLIEQLESKGYTVTQLD